MIVSIDVGKGTEDVMIVYDEKQPLENAIQLVYPSSAQILKSKLQSDTSDTIVIDGEIMAGEPWHKVVYRKSADGSQKIIMSKTAAMSLRYNLDQVRSKGVEIVEDREITNYSGSRYYLRDIVWERINQIIINSGLGIDQTQTVLLACQDHGMPHDLSRSTRDFRMEAIYQPLDHRGRLEDLLIRLDRIPDILPRHQSIGRSAMKNFPHLTEMDIWVMDSSPAVILGTMNGSGTELISNVGNGHTLATFLQNGITKAIYETHTGGVEPEPFLHDLELLAQNKITHQEALDKGAHGIYINKQYQPLSLDIENYLPMKVIGPNRRKLAKLNPHYPHPGGNVMMAGPLGLIKGYKSLRNR